MSKRTIWVSDAMINARMLRPITHSFDDGLFGEKMDFAINAGRANDAGQALSADRFPPEIFVKKDADTNYDTLPDLFYASAYWVVSGAVAEIMRQYDLGQGSLYPTKVFRKDRKTPIGSDWFCLNFGNTKTAFVAQDSKQVYPFGSGKTNRWRVVDPPKDNALVVRETALEGPALWIDPSLREMFFVHGELRDALKEAGFARPFGFRKCKVI